MNILKSGQPPTQIRFGKPYIQLIWDLPLRVFHWSLVTAVTVAAVTGFITPPWWLNVHTVAGYTIGILLAFRLIWGFLGSRFSQFRTFRLSIVSAVDHVRSLMTRTPQEHLGHNPAGTWMIVALLVLLLSLTITGLIVLGGQENLGPLAAIADFTSSRFALDLHSAAAWALLAAVVAHITGVIVESLFFRHPVLKAMIFGYKPVNIAQPVLRHSRYIIRGAVIFLGVGTALLAGGLTLANKPASGWHALQTPSVYTTECGDCHSPYHPSLRDKKSWQALMSDLSNHFGEDASLNPKTASAIQSYLVANSAATFDTEVSNLIGRVDTASLRMTDTPYWVKRHDDLKSSDFKLASVGSKVNCNACHKDAPTGRFDDSKIHLPTGVQK